MNPRRSFFLFFFSFFFFANGKKTGCPRHRGSFSSAFPAAHSLEAAKRSLHQATPARRHGPTPADARHGLEGGRFCTGEATGPHGPLQGGPRSWGRNGMDWELGVNKCQLLPLEWISNEIHTFALDSVKSHFLFANVKCCLRLLSSFCHFLGLSHSMWRFPG